MTRLNLNLNLNDLSHQKKVLGNLLVISLLVIATIAGVGLYIQEQRHDAHVINVAGQQRMHVEEMVKLSLLIADGHDNERDELLATADQYNQTLSAFQRGDPERDIPQAPASVQPQLQDIRAEWRPFYVDIRTIAREPTTSAAFQAALAEVRDRHEILNRKTDEAISLYEAESERKLQWLVGALSGVLIVLIGLMVAMGVFISRRVVRPITRLAVGADRIADGDLDEEMIVLDWNDEIGSLTRSINVMKDQLVDSIREIRLFQQAVEHAEHAIYITDSEGAIEYANPAFEEITGYSADEAIGRNPRILQSGEHDEAFYEELWETILSGEPWEAEVINERKSGEQYIIDQTIAPITDAAGTVERFVAVNTDITQRKRRLQVIEVLNRVLRHNLRNGLNVIMGRADVIIDDRVERLDSTANLDKIGDRIRDDAQIIKEQGADLHGLGEKAGQVATVLEGEGSTAPRRVLSSMLAEEKAALQEAYSDADLSIVTPSSTSIYISTDSQLQTALHELLENALEHNDQSTTVVEVSVAVRQSRVEVAIADNGPGIPQDEREVLQRGEETPLLHGSGIGLWLVYWIATAAGGNLSIEANVPRGSVVTLSVPADPGRVQVRTNDTRESSNG